MILEHEKDPVSAKWNAEQNNWNIGEKTKYRWVDNNTGEVKSDWFYEIQDALDWIIANDSIKTVEDWDSRKHGTGPLTGDY